MNADSHRRAFLISSVAATLASAQPSSQSKLPRFGIVVQGEGPDGPEAALAKVHRLGFPTCQLSVHDFGADLAPKIRAAADQFGIEITALMTLGSGRMVWNLRDGPQTIGIIPRDTRAARIDALKRCSDLAHACGVPAVHTHCGFIPENPAEPMYAEAVAAIHDVASHCRSNGQTFLCETGQETPITLLRAIQDSGLDNIAVNLDMANLILYGKGDPVGALDVVGPLVRGTHAKDGLYPTDPYGLGKEVAIGSGRVRFAEVMRKLHALSYSGPITIEREISGPKQEADIHSARIYLDRVMRHEYGVP
jgi:sugar phosphate isomerase/epimerase